MVGPLNIGMTRKEGEQRAREALVMVGLLHAERKILMIWICLNESWWHCICRGNGS